MSGDLVGAYTELYSDQPTSLDDLRVRLEVADSESGPARTTTTTTPQPGTRPDNRVVSAAVSVESLPPGPYVARAIVMRGDEPLAQLSRPFWLTRPMSSVAAAAARPAVAAVDAMTPSPASADVIKRLLGDAVQFQSETLLSQEVLGLMMDRLDNGRPVLQAVTADVRAGKVTGAGRRAFDTGDQMAAAFLQGLDLYSQGQWNPAATQFNAALSIEPDFAPASLYLGACYAIGGRDEQAATAWRRAMLAPEMSPAVRHLLADALVRTGAFPEAQALLHEGLEAHPADDTLTLRLAIIHALQLEFADATDAIAPYLERHPDDDTALLLALVALFSGDVDGSAPLDDASLDRMRQYADTYVAARGAHASLVLDWVRYVGQP